MTGAEMREARAALGRLWGFGRPLHMTEMGRACRLGGADPGQSIRDYERGTTRISGPLSALIELYLLGTLPPDGLSALEARPATPRVDRGS
jgi:hypothetical protein